MVHFSGPEKIRSSNQAAILRTIRESGHISRGEIARRLQLHPSTVTRLVEQLIAEGLVHEREDRGRSSARGGRRTIPLEFNYESSLIAGVDLSGSRIKGALTNLAGHVLHRTDAPIAYQRSDENLARLIALIENLLAASRPAEQYIRGIGIGAPAVTLNEEGIVTWAPSLGWRDLRLKACLEERFRLPVFVENDVNLATLGEHWRGAAQGAGHVVGVFVGSGIGAGIIIDNELYRGSTRAAGEVGYLIYDLACFDESGGDFGWLESMASGPGTVRRALEAIRRGETSPVLALAGEEGSIAPGHIFQAARQGDPLALHLANDTARYLSVAISSVISILDPEVVVIGGGSAWAEDLLLEPIIEHVCNVVPGMPTVVPAQLGSDAVMLGAVSLVLHATDHVVLIGD
ncbi:MAG: ROK family protein [Anaerolineae bacterium]